MTPDPRDTEIPRLRSLLAGIEERAQRALDNFGRQLLAAVERTDPPAREPVQPLLREIRDLAALREKPG